MVKFKLLSKVLVLFLVIAIIFTGCTPTNNNGDENQVDQEPPNDNGGEEVIVKITDEGLLSGETVAQLSDKYEDYVIGMRRELHQHPELGGEEQWTSERIRKELDEMGIPYEMAGEYGIVAIIKGATEGKTVALRADLDALPLPELNDKEFKSQIEGKMHACGHDGHMAMLLGAGKILMEVKDKLNGTVLLVFEQDEEMYSDIVDGAQDVMDVVADMSVDAFYGMHCNTTPVGTIDLDPGVATSIVGQFKVKVTGKGAHGATPNLGIDPIIPMAEMITALNNFTVKTKDPFDLGIINVTMINSGFKNNVIPGEGTFEGGLRVVKLETGEKMVEEFERIVTNIAEAYNVQVEITMNKPDGLLIDNDPKLAAIAQESAVKTGTTVISKPTSPYSETFTLYGSKYPVIYGFVGIGEYPPFHTPFMDLDEAGFKYGVRTQTQFAIDFLNAE